MTFHRGIWMATTACLALALTISTSSAMSVSDPQTPTISARDAAPTIQLAQQISIPTGRKISGSKKVVADQSASGTVAGGGGGSGGSGGGSGGGGSGGGGGW